MGHDEDMPTEEAGDLRTTVIATASFLLVFAANAVPVPLYDYYQQAIGISDTLISFTNVAYLAGVMAVLFFAGSISDALGRKPVTVAALALSIAGNVIMLTLTNGVMLQVSRVLEGAAVGLCMSAIAAFVVDAAGRRYRDLAVMVTSCGSLVGITIGSLAAGVMGSVTTSYGVIYATFIVLAAAFIALTALLANETVVERAGLGARARSSVRIPESIRGIFPLAGSLYICLWGAGMYFQSLSTPACVEYFASTGPLIPAIVMAGALLPSVVGSALEARLAPKPTLALCMATYVVSCVGVSASMHAAALVPFVLFDALFGVSVGIGLSLAMHLAVDAARPGENAVVVSGINFTGYVGAITASVVMTALTVPLSLAAVFEATAVLCALAMIPGLRCARKVL